MAQPDINPTINKAMNVGLMGKLKDHYFLGNQALFLGVISTFLNKSVSVSIHLCALGADKNPSGSLQVQQQGMAGYWEG